MNKPLLFGGIAAVVLVGPFWLQAVRWNACVNNDVKRFGDLPSKVSFCNGGGGY